MARTYKLDSVIEMDGKDVETYGQPYWCTTTDDDKALMFNIKGSYIPQPGDTVSYEESLNKQSKKGTDYLFLKKVSKYLGEQETLPEPIGDVSHDTPSKKAEDIAMQLDRIERKLDKALTIMIGDDL